LKTNPSLNSGYQEIHREIIELSKTGNVKAQFELYSLYSRAMFSICMRMLNRREEAEDILQEAFTEIFDKLDSFRFESAFGAWTKRIVINKCINHLRKRRPDIRYEAELKDGETEEENVDYENIKLQVEKVKRAMMELPDGFRIIFSLHALEGYDHEEISGILGISQSTSKTQYMRAKVRIKDIILQMK
jgi:RNA polymerase sigma factor (sigma-70 family)